MENFYFGNMEINVHSEEDWIFVFLIYLDQLLAGCGTKNILAC
jgi:hypothetical protein